MNKLPKALAEAKEGVVRGAIIGPDLSREVVLTMLERIELAALADGIEFPPKDGEIRNVRVENRSDSTLITYDEYQSHWINGLMMNVNSSCVKILRQLFKEGKL